MKSKMFYTIFVFIIINLCFDVTFALSYKNKYESSGLYKDKSFDCDCDYNYVGVGIFASDVTIENFNITDCRSGIDLGYFPGTHNYNNIQIKNPIITRSCTFDSREIRDFITDTNLVNHVVFENLNGKIDFISGTGSRPLHFDYPNARLGLGYSVFINKNNLSFWIGTVYPINFMDAYVSLYYLPSINNPIAQKKVQDGSYGSCTGCSYVTKILNTDGTYNYSFFVDSVGQDPASTDLLISYKIVSGCVQNGQTCTSGSECCSGFCETDENPPICVPESGGDDNPGQVCNPTSANSSSNLTWEYKEGTYGCNTFYDGSYDAYDILVDSNRNIYTSTSHSNTGGSDATCYLKKFDTNKNLLWERSTGCPLGHRARLDVDNSGNIYFITGNNFFKYNPDGFGLLNVPLGPFLPYEHDYGMDITVSSTGDIYFSGRYSKGYLIPALILFKFSPSGQYVWNRTANSFVGENRPGKALDTDSAGNIYVTGDRHTRKFSSNGVLLWSKQGPEYNDIFVDKSNNIYLVGSNTVKYDLSGNKIWEVSSGGDHISTDTAGNIYVTSSTDTIKYGQDCNPLWDLKYCNDTGRSYSNKIYRTKAAALDSQGFVYSVGSNVCESYVNKYRRDFCGDGTKGCIEQCDDGDIVDGDGCSSKCLLEPAVNGDCGSANGTKIYISPTTGLCDSGTQSSVVYDPTSYTFNWTCKGNSLGSNETCFAYRKIDGKCGNASRKYLYTDTGFGSDIPCYNGTLSGNFVFPTQCNETKWNCDGKNGGNPAFGCTANRSGQYMCVCPAFNISCTSSVHGVNSIYTYVNTNPRIECGNIFLKWVVYDAWFTCNLGGKPFGTSYEVVCSIDPIKSYQNGTDKSTWITLAECGSYCGDDNQDAGEECDDGASNSDTIQNRCRSNNCQTAGQFCCNPWCGDAVVDKSPPNQEQCDNGTFNQNGPYPVLYGINMSYCNQTCKINNVTGPYCGDTFVNGNEECDYTGGNCLSNCQCAEGYYNESGICHPNIYINTTLSEDSDNPNLTNYSLNKNISDNIVISNRISKTVQDFYLKNWYSNDCNDLKFNKADNTNCSYSSGEVIYCNITLDGAFSTFDQNMVFYGCAKISGTWYKSPPEYLNVTSRCGDMKISLPEQCDNGTYNSNSCKSIYGFDGSCDYCNLSCAINTNISYCGDAIIDYANETCDNGTLKNANSCDAMASGGSCDYCNLSCARNTNQTSVCWNGQIEPNEDCENNSHNYSLYKCNNLTHINETKYSCDNITCKWTNQTNTSYCGDSNACQYDMCISIKKTCLLNEDCKQDECCYGASEYHNGTCIGTLPSGITNDTINNNECLCRLSKGGFGDKCDLTGESPCWDIVTGNCCGNEDLENWTTSKSTSKLLEDILIPGYCYKGEWLSREDNDLTYYSMWVVS